MRGRAAQQNFDPLGGAIALRGSDVIDARNCVIRGFESNDRDACLQVFDTNVPEFFRDPEREEFERFLDDLPGPYIVLQRGAEVIGCGGYALREAGEVADLCWGMIRRDHHRTGLGAELAAMRVRLALEDPRVRELALSTSQHTVGFYQKVGFTLLSVEPSGYGPGLDRCEMRMDAPSGENG